VTTRRAVAAGVFVAACASLFGCDGSDDCVARGTQASYAGSASYISQAAPGEPYGPIDGAMPATVVVYDATASCTYDGMSFFVGVGGCILWADLTSSDPDAGADFTASIEPGQSCTLGLASGPLTLTITSGELSVGAQVAVTLGGNVASDGGATYLEWSFVGQ